MFLNNKQTTVLAVQKRIRKLFMVLTLDIKLFMNFRDPFIFKIECRRGTRTNEKEVFIDMWLRGLTPNTRDRIWMMFREDRRFQIDSWEFIKKRK